LEDSPKIAKKGGKRTFGGAYTPAKTVDLLVIENYEMIN
jgi:hypothetical protein